MTKSRISADRVLLGILGKLPDSGTVLSEWNRYMRAAGMDGSMDRYPCTEKTIPERLSQMMHFDRRGYIVAPFLQKALISFMDALDVSAKEKQIVDTIVNNGGILTGYWFDGDDGSRRKLWAIP